MRLLALLAPQLAVLLHGEKVLLLRHILQAPERQSPFPHTSLDGSCSLRHGAAGRRSDSPCLARQSVEAALLRRHLYDKRLTRRPAAPRHIAQIVAEHLRELFRRHLARTSRRIAVAVRLSGIRAQQKTQQKRCKIARRNAVVFQQAIAQFSRTDLPSRRKTLGNALFQIRLHDGDGKPAHILPAPILLDIPNIRQHAPLRILDRALHIARERGKRRLLQSVRLIVAFRRHLLQIECMGLSAQHDRLQDLGRLACPRELDALGLLCRIDDEASVVNAILPLLFKNLLRLPHLLLRCRSIVPLIVGCHRGKIHISLESVVSQRRSQSVEENDMTIAVVPHRLLDLGAKSRRFLLVLGEGKQRLELPGFLRCHIADGTRERIDRRRLHNTQSVQKARLQPLGLQRQQFAQAAVLHELVRLRRLSQFLLVLLDLPLIAAEHRQIIRRLALLTRRHDQYAALLQGMRSRAHAVHEGIVPLEHIGKVAIRRLQKLDIAAKLLLHGEQDQDGLEHRLLLLAQICLLLVRIENHADMCRQVRLAAHIKEIP